MKLLTFEVLPEDFDFRVGDSVNVDIKTTDRGVLQYQLGEIQTTEYIGMKGKPYFRIQIDVSARITIIPYTGRDFPTACENCGVVKTDVRSVRDHNLCNQCYIQLHCITE